MRFFPCLCLSLLLFQASLSAQEGNRRINEIMQEADGRLIRLELEAARALYQKALKKNPDYAPALRGMARAYEMESDYENAEIWQSQLIEKSPNFSKVMYYELGRIRYRKGDYAGAIEAFERFGELKGLPPKQFGYNGVKEMYVERQYLSQLGNALHECRYAKDSIHALGISEVVNLGDSINSPSNDYFPFLTNDGNTLLFTRMISPSNEDLLYSTKNNDGFWNKGERLKGEFNTPLNEGMSTCTRDNIRLYFTICEQEGVQGTCDIQEARLSLSDSISVSGKRTLRGRLNSGSWESQASVSCDGQLLFFASRRPGGMGKTDIWMSRRQADGTWGEPSNLGGNINTEDYEESPFITNDGKTLFFSSTGWLGMGEQDIFMSRLQADGTWGKPVNLGNKINTHQRELGFFLTADGKTGYFASDKAGGKGGLDIYQFSLSKPIKSDPITFVEGFVKDSLSRQPVKTLLQVSDGRLIDTDEQGRFFRCLPPGDFIFRIEEEGYLPYGEREVIPEWDNRTFYQMEILLQKEIPREIPESNPLPKPRPQPEPKPVRSMPLSATVYFDFDKYDIRPDAEATLREFSAALRDRPDARITLWGYCDLRGSDAYNIRLSRQRAEAVRDWLIRAGISSDKIQFQAMGEVNDEQPFQINRRVTIRVE